MSLVREPERRLYRELIAAGLRIQLREDRQSGQPAYDIADLRLRFDVFDANEQKVRIRFDPAKGAFFGENLEWFRFEDLMFEAERCMQRVRDGFKGVNAWLTQFVPDLIFFAALCRLRGIELENHNKTADR